MNPTTLATGLVRIVAIYGLVDAASSLTYTIQWVFFPPQNATGADIAFLGAALVVRMVALAALLIFAPQLGRFAFRGHLQPDAQWPAREDLEGAALFFLGCYLMAYTAVDAARLIGKLYLYEGYAARFGGVPIGTQAQIQPNDYAQIWSTAVKLVLALMFMFFSRGIVAFKDFVLRLRT
jgi:hypothetical protein